MSTDVLCNNEKCKFNQSQSCTSKQIGIVDDMCVTRRRGKPEDNYSELMRTHNPNCRKDGGGKYVSSRVTGVLK